MDSNAWILLVAMGRAVALTGQLVVAGNLRNGDILELRNQAIADHIEKFKDPAEQKAKAPLFPAEKVKAPRPLPANLISLPAIAALNWGRCYLSEAKAPSITPQP